MNIKEKILLHAEVYDNRKCITPPFRLTCAEHKELLTIMNSGFSLTEHQKSDRVTRYYGTELELIVIVEDYGV